MQAKMRLISLHDVEDGVAHARSTADKRALDMAAAEHERLIIPLREKFTALDRTSTTTRAGLQETTRTLKEHETRLASLEAQKRSTTAAIAVAERAHASYLSGLSAQQPAPANPATFVAPAAQQPPAAANLVTFVTPAARQPASANLASFVAPVYVSRLWPTSRLRSPPLPRSLWLRTPPWSPPLSLRRDLWVLPPLPQSNPRLSLFQIGQPCRRRPPENPRPPHPGRSWSRVHTGSLNANRPPLPKMTPTSSCPSQN